MAEAMNVEETVLQQNARLFEEFWLRPKRYEGRTVPLRIRINSKWGGWKLKDELVTSLGLEVGDTISTEVTPYFMTGIIDEKNDTDMFASGDGADWLLKNDVTVGTVIDCEVQFAYTKAPVGPNGKEVFKVSLIFKRGLAVVDQDQSYIAKQELKSKNLDDLIRNLLS